MGIRAFILLLQGVAMSHALTTEAAPSLKARIHSNVHRTLQRQGTANIMVTMRASTQSVHESLPLEASFTTRGAMITDMVEKLEAHCPVSDVWGDCPVSDVLSCAEFITCPTNPSGSTRDCSKAPNIIVNDWGSSESDPNVRAMIFAWRRAGVIPISGVANGGPDCTTTGSPHDSPYVISVGSTDRSDALASFSGRGPTLAGLTKPDVVAPGQFVSLPWGTDDYEYVTASGGFHSAGCVAGVVALMLSSEPTLKFDQVRQKLLFEGTDQATLPPADRECGGTPNGQFPNNMYGYGRVNALKAVNSKRVPVAGQCGGLVNPVCNSIFFCMWSNVKQNCQSWW